MSKYSKNTHLTKEEIIKNGSIFTPEHIVKLVFDKTQEYLDNIDVIGDFGSGYGAFIDYFKKTKKRCFGTEADEMSFLFLMGHFNNDIYLENSLKNVNRKKYGLKRNDRLLIIGNPPYNDVTSQYKNGKKGSIACDIDLKSRDLGISFLKLYNKLSANYICVLHPLSYLIKKQNFSSLKQFKDNYKLIDATIFSSKEFESIKKSHSDFPVVAALYIRNNDGMDYDYIENFKFSIYNSKKVFCLNEIYTIDGVVQKYPTKAKKTKLQFYTQRDMNSLCRNTTFIDGNKANGISVDLDNLYQYCWLYFLKQNFNPSINKYIYGNLSPLYINEIEGKDTKNCIVSYAFNNCPLIEKYFKKEDIEKKYGVITTNYDVIFDILKKLYIFNE